MTERDKQLNIFKLGIAETGSTSYFNGAIDDLKIYDVELTQTQVTSLYNNNTLTSNKNIRANKGYKVYPTIASDVLYFDNANEVLNKEIYTLNGVKVAETYNNDISIAHLAAGIYLVKFTNAEGENSFSKFSKN